MTVGKNIKQQSSYGHQLPLEAGDEKKKISYTKYSFVKGKNILRCSNDCDSDEN